MHRCQVWQILLEPLLVDLAAGVVGTAQILQALCHLHQKHPPHAALVEQRQQLVQRLWGVALDTVATQVGYRASRLVGRHPFGQPTQAFYQHHTQGSGQRPHFTQVEFASFLVGVEKLHQQFFVESPIGMRHKSPGNTVDPRQARQRRVKQQRKAAKVAARQPVVNLLELSLDKVEIVQQPFGRRRNVIAGAGLLSDVAVGFAQYPDVVAQAWKKTRAMPSRALRAMGFAQTAPMLGETLRAKYLGANGWLRRSPPPVENVAQRLGRVRDETLQPALRHRSGKKETRAY